MTPPLAAAPDLSPAAPPIQKPGRRRGPRPAQPAGERGPELREPTGLHEPRLVRAFQDMLRRRGAPAGLEVYRVARPHPLLCEPCFAAAAAAVGLRLVRETTLPGEEGLQEPHLRLSWYFDRVEERVDPVLDDEPGEARAGEGREARFYADTQQGLLRLVPEAGGEPLWIWLYAHQDLGDEALVALPRRAALRPFLTELHRREVEHGRSSTGLILIGNHGEGRAERRALDWEELVLPPGLREEIEGTVREFFAAAALYKRHGIPHRRGILLAGPPGNGKTSILRAIGSTLSLPLIVATLDSPQEVHNTRHAFQRAAALAPAILCFEDLDALVGEGPGLSQFLNQLDGLEPLEGVLVLATTNRPDRIDPAIARRPSRFDRVFVIPEPDRAQRQAFLTRRLGRDAPAGAAARLAEATEGYSVAFLKELVLQARLLAVRRGEEALQDADLDAALATTREHLRLAAAGLEDRGTVGFGASG